MYVNYFEKRLLLGDESAQVAQVLHFAAAAVSDSLSHSPLLASPSLLYSATKNN